MGVRILWVGGRVGRVLVGLRAWVVVNLKVVSEPIALTSSHWAWCCWSTICQFDTNAIFCSSYPRRFNRYPSPSLAIPCYPSLSHRYPLLFDLRFVTYVIVSNQAKEIMKLEGRRRRNCTPRATPPHITPKPGWFQHHPSPTPGYSPPPCPTRSYPTLHSRIRKQATHSHSHPPSHAHTPSHEDTESRSLIHACTHTPAHPPPLPHSAKVAHVQFRPLTSRLHA